MKWLTTIALLAALSALCAATTRRRTSTTGGRRSTRRSTTRRTGTTKSSGRLAQDDFVETLHKNLFPAAAGSSWRPAAILQSLYRSILGGDPVAGKLHAHLGSFEVAGDLLMERINKLDVSKADATQAFELFTVRFEAKAVSVLADRLFELYARNQVSDGVFDALAAHLVPYSTATMQKCDETYGQNPIFEDIRKVVDEFQFFAVIPRHNFDMLTSPISVQYQLKTPYTVVPELLQDMTDIFVNYVQGITKKGKTPAVVTVDYDRRLAEGTSGRNAALVDARLVTLMARDVAVGALNAFARRKCDAARLRDILTRVADCVKASVRRINADADAAATNAALLSVHLASAQIVYPSSLAELQSKGIRFETTKNSRFI